MHPFPTDPSSPAEHGDQQGTRKEVGAKHSLQPYSQTLKQDKNRATGQGRQGQHQTEGEPTSTFSVGSWLDAGADSAGVGRGLRLCTPSKLPGGRCGSCGSVAHTAFSQVLSPTQPLSVVTSLFLTTGNARMFCSALPFVSKCKQPQNESKNKDATLIYRVRDKGMRALPKSWVFLEVCCP